MSPRPGKFGSARQSALLLAGLTLTVSAAIASEFIIEPWVTVEESWEDNIFYTTTDEESDFITRVTPGVVLGYESERLDFNGTFSFDSEAYLHNSDLNSAVVRALANLGLDYRLTRRLTLGASVDYLDTDTPIDFLQSPGGGIPTALGGRFGAKRLAAAASANYRISRRWNGSVTARLVDDDASGPSRSKLHALETAFDHKLSNASTVLYGYRANRYRLTTEADGGTATDRQTFHVPWVGYTHALTERLNLSARGGPIFGEDSTDTYFAASASFRNRRGSVSASYERDQTTLLGDARVVDYSSWSLTFEHDLESGVSLLVSPGYTTVSSPEGGSDDYTSLRVGASYTVNQGILLTAGYELNNQSSAGGAEVRHNLIEVGVTFSFPRPKRKPIPR